MNVPAVTFSVYLFLAIYCAGSMTVLQMQHFALYPKVGRKSFREYISANNRAAVIPAILPAVLLLISTGILLIIRPCFMPVSFAVISFSLNLINLISTAVWQWRIHGRLEKLGYDQNLIEQLVNTNWIRTIVLLLQAFLALYCVVKSLKFN